MADEDKAPSKEEKAEEKAPETTQQDKPEVKKEESGAPEQKSELPEKLQGKSAEDIAKMYQEAEKKMHDTTSKLSELERAEQQMNVVLQAIAADPELYKNVEGAVQKFVKAGEQPSGQLTQSQQNQGKQPEAPKAERSDQRAYLENQIIAEFQKRYGIEKLDAKEKQEAMQKVSAAWAQMVDPRGTKTKQELLSEQPLDALSQQLDNAYWIAHKDALMEKGTASAQEVASIGSTPSSSGKSEGGVSLSTQERSIAEKLGVKPEKYAKRKQQIRSQFTE